MFHVTLDSARAILITLTLTLASLIGSSVSGGPLNFLDRGSTIPCRRGKPIDISKLIPGVDSWVKQCYKCTCPSGHIKCYMSSRSSECNRGSKAKVDLRAGRNISESFGGHNVVIGPLGSVCLTRGQSQLDRKCDDLVNFDGQDGSRVVDVEKREVNERELILRSKPMRVVCRACGNIADHKDLGRRGRISIAPEHICWIIDETTEVCGNISSGLNFLTGLLVESPNESLAPHDVQPATNASRLVM